jgi:hypothetical protein
MPLEMTTMQHCLDMMGENIVDDRVWIVKSHHPMPNPLQRPFNSNKVVCIVRNPLDVIHSMLQLKTLISHSATLEYDTNTEFPKEWDLFVKWCSRNIDDYYRVLM